MTVWFWHLLRSCLNTVEKSRELFGDIFQSDSCVYTGEAGLQSENKNLDGGGLIGSDCTWDFMNDSSECNVETSLVLDNLTIHPDGKAP